MVDDFSELTSLAADLTQAPEGVGRFAEKALKTTALHVKKDWQRGAARTGLKDYALDIDYEITYGPGEIIAYIGPTPGDAGGLGIVEDAPGGVRSAPQHAGRDALEANEDDFVRGMAIAAYDATVEAVKK